MPPKAKFTKEEIIETSISIVRKEGFSALTARALGAELGSSARPIFTVFKSMEEVRQEVINASKKLYNEYVKKGLSQKIQFKGVGEQYILFAIKEPKLFQLLFMKEQRNVPKLSEVLPIIDENYETILMSIRDGYGMDSASAQKLYHHLWIYTHGIATLCATKMCCFTAKQIGEMMTEVFVSLLKNMKAGEGDD